MRTFWDRVRYVVSFELIGLAIIMTTARLFTDMSVASFGVTAVLLSVLATVWNAVLAYAFDRYLTAKQGHCNKTTMQRVAYALGFETGLIIITVPIIALILNVTWLEAFVIDLGIITFFLFYAYAFSWAYDRLFPVTIVRDYSAQPSAK